MVEGDNSIEAAYIHVAVQARTLPYSDSDGGGRVVFYEGKMIKEQQALNNRTQNLKQQLGEFGEKRVQKADSEIETIIEQLHAMQREPDGF